MKEYIEQVKACKTSSEMYSICEELAQCMSDTGAGRVKQSGSPAIVGSS